MISPKLAVLMTTLALVGAASPILAAATNGHDGHDDPNGNSLSVERNNSIKQSNEQEQYACTNEQDNEAENEADDVDDDQVAIAAGGDQSNDCVVVQAASAENNAAIVDASDNDITAVLADLNLDDVIALGL